MKNFLYKFEMSTELVAKKMSDGNRGHDNREKENRSRLGLALSFAISGLMDEPRHQRTGTSNCHAHIERSRTQENNSINES